MINLHESIGPGAIPGSAVRHASVARHVTDCATRPSNQTVKLDRTRKGGSYKGLDY